VFQLVAAGLLTKFGEHFDGRAEPSIERVAALATIPQILENTGFNGTTRAIQFIMD